MTMMRSERIDCRSALHSTDPTLASHNHTHTSTVLSSISNNGDVKGGGNNSNSDGGNNIGGGTSNNSVNSNNHGGNSNRPLRIASFNCGAKISDPYNFEKLLLWANKRNLDVFGVQEVGDVKLSQPNYVNLLQRYSFHGIVCSVGKYNGVAIFMRSSIVPSIIKKYEDRNVNGRAIGCVISVQGVSILFVSAYMPSGLDHIKTDTNKKCTEAKLIYSTIIRWCKTRVTAKSTPPSRVIIMGDLNETLTSEDRRTVSKVSTRIARFIQVLPDYGFTDCIRLLHPHPKPIFTHHSAAHGSDARIDYIWTHGIDSRLISSANVTKVPFVDGHDHRAVVVEIKDIWSTFPTYQTDYPILPNLRRATDSQKQRMIAVMEANIKSNHDVIVRLASSSDRNDIEELGSILLKLATDAVAILPVTNRNKKKPTRPRPTTQFRRAKRQRIALSQLLKLLTQLQNNNIWSVSHIEYRLAPLYRKLRPIIRDWPVLLDNRQSITSWISLVSKAVAKARYDVKRSAADMNNNYIIQFDKNPTAATNEMLRGDRTADVDSIIDHADVLHTNPDRLKQTLSNFYRGVFTDSKRPIDPLLEKTFEHVYQPKAGVDPKWYQGLMDDVSDKEMTSMISDLKSISAPGDDGVGGGIWKLLCQSPRVRSCIAIFISCCFRLRIMPSFGKKSIIHPILKRATGEKTLDNIRPISLQSALAKLISKILSDRLGIILAKYKILHPAQHGFLPGGDSQQCIDTVLDIWLLRRIHKRACYNIFYDIRQAYDSVRGEDVIRALTRLRMPKEFIELIQDSLTGLTSCVRTPYGNTDEFPVQRSIRQGDPLAPLLFICFMDTLHCGYESPPVTAAVVHDEVPIQYPPSPPGTAFIPLPAQDSAPYWPPPSSSSSYPGYSHYNRTPSRVRKADFQVASRGFADDTWVTSDTIEGIIRLHQWTLDWMHYHCMQLHPTKTQVVGVDDKGKEMTACPDIQIDGQVLQPLSLSTPIRYLGATVRMDMESKDQISAIKDKVGWYCHCIARHHLRPDQAIFIVDKFLIPAISYSLRVVHLNEVDKEKIDNMISKVISRACCNSIRIIKADILSAITGVTLPSVQWQKIAVGEEFIRLNHPDPSKHLISKVVWRESHHYANPIKKNRVSRAKQVAAHLGYELREVNSASVPSNWIHNNHLPTGHGCTKAYDYFDGEDNKIHTVNGWKGTWGSNEYVTNTVVQVCTDGSHKVVDNVERSSWAICLISKTISDIAASFPQEHKIMESHVRTTSAYCGTIRCSDSIFMAELQAIYRALLSLPIHTPMRIYSDSQAAVKAVQAYRQYSHDMYARKRLRSPGRPLLQLIDIVCKKKYESRIANPCPSPVVEIVWTRSHNRSNDVISVGNRIADYVANRAIDAKQHITLNRETILDGKIAGATQKFIDLDLSSGENFICIYDKSKQRIVYGDIRKEIKHKTYEKSVQNWNESKSQNLFANYYAECSLFWKWVVKKQPKQSTFALRLMANVLHYNHIDRPNMCNNCNQEDNSTHMLTCSYQPRLERRIILCNRLKAMFMQKRWNKGNDSGRRSLRDRVIAGNSGPAHLFANANRRHFGDVRALLQFIGFHPASTHPSDPMPFGIFARTTITRFFDIIPMASEKRDLFIDNLRVTLLNGWREIWNQRNVKL